MGLTIWPQVYDIVDRHPDREALRRHGLLPLAIAHWRRTGRPVPYALEVERAAAAAFLIEANHLVARLASSHNGPFLVFKGPEVSALYPDPALRVLKDVDVLVRDADRVHDQLVGAGWQEMTGPGVLRWYDDIHQTHPLVVPGLTLPLELHRRPNWPRWGTPPPIDELFEAAQASVVRVEGALSPSTEHHALLVLAHAWWHQPWERFSQLIDFALLLEQSDAAVLRSTARRWQLEQLLDVAARTVDSILLGRGRVPPVVRWCAPHLRDLGRVSPLRQQVDRYAASLFVTRPTEAARAAVEGVGRRVRTMVRGARSRA
jgi:hypothetical protein